MKLRTLVESFIALKELGSLSFKATKAFEIKTFNVAVLEEVKAFEEIQIAKAKEYGEPGEKESTYTFPDPEKAKKFNEEMKELGEKEIAIDVPELVVADLGEQVVSIATLTTLDWLIK